MSKLEIDIDQVLEDEAVRLFQHVIEKHYQAANKELSDKMWALSDQFAKKVSEQAKIELSQQLALAKKPTQSQQKNAKGGE